MHIGAARSFSDDLPQKPVLEKRATEKRKNHVPAELRSLKVNMEESLVFSNLPSHRSSRWEDSEPRQSYYNNKQAVPFKWEAAPGKPVIAMQKSCTSTESTRLRPPPIPSKSTSVRLSTEEEFGVYSDLESIPSFHWTTGCAESNRTTEQEDGEGSSFSSKYARHAPPNNGLSRWANRGDDSKRSDFDWPEVSENGDNPEEDAGHVVKGEEELGGRSFSSSACFSSSTPSSSSSNAGSLREIILLRKFSMIPGPLSRPDQGEGDLSCGVKQKEDKERPVRGFLSCMPIFSKLRIIQSQTGTEEKCQISSRNCLSPGIKNDRS